ncbi:DUF6994 family protein [Xylanimonas ulmi]|uniref:DUF6994 family protein n=1 Tax=Xylanimonas ulmi TaxID=228973 RepID=UPI00102BAFA3|nr:hypothetical protein [Xylanibacterium ulmi]
MIRTRVQVSGFSHASADTNRRTGWPLGGTRETPRPLGATIARYASFLALFREFDGYVEHFLPHDLIQGVSQARLFVPCVPSTGLPCHETSASTVRSGDNSMALVQARNARIRRRGSDRGTCLRPLAQIVFAEVTRSIDGPFATVSGEDVEDVSDPGGSAAVRDAWVALRDAMRSVLDATTLPNADAWQTMSTGAVSSARRRAETTEDRDPDLTV